MVIITCEICKNDFTVFPYRLKRKDAVTKYCSKKCLYEGRVGRKHTEETKIKMSKAHGAPTWLFNQAPWNKGLIGVQVAWNKNKPVLQIRGEKHWNWQGGKTGESRKIRRSLEYRVWRHEVLKRDNYACVFCGETGVKLDADHIKPFSLFPELRLDINNGRALCRPCHLKTNTYGSKSSHYRRSWIYRLSPGE